MNEHKIRTLLLCSHPTQYGVPMWRRISQHPNVEALVAYCSLDGAEPHVDSGFGVKVAWDIPLLDGYRWIKLKNFSPSPRVGPFFGLINPGIWRLIRNNRFDAIAIYTGYMCVTFWIALAAAKLYGIPVMYGTDATTLLPSDRRDWKITIKKRLWPLLFRAANVVIVPSSGAAELIRALGIPQKRIKLTPYVVDNHWWTENSHNTDRSSIRSAWKIPAEARVVLFCAKLQPWKRPLDLLRAFARANAPDSYLVYAGQGPLRDQLEREANHLGISDRVRFLGFVNQSALPKVYGSADLFVLASDYEPFGLVVNEAMLCGCPVIVSDSVGARLDLVRHGETGLIYRTGDVEALGTILSAALKDPDRLRAMGQAARARMAEWCPDANLEATVEAFAQAIELRKFRVRT